MSAKFVAASTTFLRNASPPITAVPFTVGFWCFTTIGDNIPWSLTGATDAFGLYILGGGTTYRLFCTAGTEDDIDIAGPVLSRWLYVVIRCISATNRRMHILDGVTGAIVSGQGTVSKIPSVTVMNLGRYDDATNYYSGSLAEYFMTNTDIQSDGAVIDSATMRQLAYRGPFSIPHVANSIVEYHAFRSSLGSDSDRLGEVVYGNKGLQTWANTGVTIGVHPPLQSDYVRPADTRRILMV